MKIISKQSRDFNKNNYLKIDEILNLNIIQETQINNLICKKIPRSLLIKYINISINLYRKVPKKKKNMNLINMKI